MSSVTVLLYKKKETVYLTTNNFVVCLRACGLLRVRTAQGKPGKRDFLKKFRENLENSGNFPTIFTTSGNFILPNISDQIGGALRINEASKRINGTHSPTLISLFVKLLYLAP